MKHLRFINNCLLLFAGGIWILLLANCKDDGDTNSVYDPSRPFICESFLPDSGGVSTKLIIQGENFGTDTSIVKVFVNNNQAKVIGISDKSIYAIVPARAGTGKIRVEIGSSPAIQTYEFNKNFDYVFRENVSTLCGQTNDNGESRTEDGTFETAWLQAPIWFDIDKEGDLYTLQWQAGLRIVSPMRNEVTTPLQSHGDIHTVRACSFDLTKDTLYVANDQGSISGTGLFFLTRDDGFMKARNLVNAQEVNGFTINPVDGEIFYTHFTSGNIYRYDKTTKESVLMFTANPHSDMQLAFSRTGKTMYIIYKFRHMIAKADYDFDTKTLKNSEAFIGSYDRAGNQEGAGTGALINTPCQLVCDEDDNIYLCDSNNHCIRKITPAGIMTTYAGVPGKAGYADGLPLEAEFRSPEAIAIDGSGALYIGDAQNHRIRKIVVE